MRAFKPVIIESRYAGDVERNLSYLRACMRDCLLRGEAPLASHGLYTQPGVLDDNDPAEREMGIAAGTTWRPLATLTVFYVDLGWSKGMNEALLDCVNRKLPWEKRLLGGVWCRDALVA